MHHCTYTCAHTPQNKNKYVHFVKTFFRWKFVVCALQKTKLKGGEVMFGEVVGRVSGVS